MKPRRSVSPSLSSLVAIEHCRRIGNECLGLGIGRHGHRAAGRADGLERAGLAHDEVVRHRVGVEEHDLHGLAGLDDEPFEVEAEFLRNRLDADDLHAERAQVATDGALRVVRQLRGQLFAELDGVEGPGSVRRSWRVWRRRRRRWRGRAARWPPEARRFRNALERRDGRARGAGSASGLTSRARRSKVAASRRVHPRASRAAVFVAASLRCVEQGPGDRREELSAQVCAVPDAGAAEGSARRAAARRCAPGASGRSATPHPACHRRS